MFKFFALCLVALVACAAAKPGIISPLAYSAATPIVAASPYTAAAYTAGAYYASPYAYSTAAYAAPYAAPYAAAYSAYPYSASILLRR